MIDAESFDEECRVSAARMAADAELRKLTHNWVLATADHRYVYNFRWMGLPVIQFPQDLIALQELIWSVQPGVVIETGVARGGSLAFHASLLQLIGRDGIVVGVDIDIRAPNREAIERLPVSSRIKLVQGSSTDAETLSRVAALVAQRKPVLVILDSNHTHEHVLAELLAYAPLVTPGSYLVVLDTIVDEMPKRYFEDRPWGPGNNPRTAVREFLANHPDFEVDRELEEKLLITVAPGGYLRRVR